MVAAEFFERRYSSPTYTDLISSIRLVAGHLRRRRHGTVCYRHWATSATRGVKVGLCFVICKVQSMRNLIPSCYAIPWSLPRINSNWVVETLGRKVWRTSSTGIDATLYVASGQYLVMSRIEMVTKTMIWFYCRDFHLSIWSDQKSLICINQFKFLQFFFLKQVSLPWEQSTGTLFKVELSIISNLSIYVTFKLKQLLHWQRYIQSGLYVHLRQNSK